MIAEQDPQGKSVDPAKALSAVESRLSGVLVPPDRIGRERMLKEMEVQLTQARQRQDTEHAQLMQVEDQQRQLQEQQGAQHQANGAMEESEMLLGQMRHDAPRMPEMGATFDESINRLSPSLDPMRVQQLRQTKQRIIGFNALLPEIDQTLRAGMAGTAQTEGVGGNPWLAMHEQTAGGITGALGEGLVSPFTGAPLSARERVLQSMQQAAEGFQGQFQVPSAEQAVRPPRTGTPPGAGGGRVGRGGRIRTEPEAPHPTDFGNTPRKLPEGMSIEGLKQVMADRMEAIVNEEIGDPTTAKSFTRHVGSALGWVAPFTGLAKAGRAVAGAVGLTGKAATFAVGELAIPGAAAFAWGTSRDLGPEDQMKVDQAPTSEQGALSTALHLRRGVQEGLLMPLYAAHMGGAGFLLKRSPVLRGLLIGGTAPAVGEGGEAITHQLAKVAREMGFESGEALADYYAARGTYGPVTSFLKQPSWEHAKEYAKHAAPQMVAFGALGLMHKAQEHARFESRKQMLEAKRELDAEVDAAVAAGKVEPEVGEAMKKDAAGMLGDLAPSHAEDRARVATERHEAAAGGPEPAKAEVNDRLAAGKLEHLPGETLAEKQAAAEERFAELDAKTERTPTEEAELRAVTLEATAAEHLARGGDESHARAIQLLEQARAHREREPAAPERSEPFQEPKAAAQAVQHEAIREVAEGPLPATRAAEAAVADRGQEFEVVKRSLERGTVQIRPVGQPSKTRWVKEERLAKYRIKEAPKAEDPLVAVAVERVKGQRRASVSFLQKTLGVTRKRSEAVLKELEAQGHVYREGKVWKVRDLERPAEEPTVAKEAPTGGTEAPTETPPAGHPVQLDPDAPRRGNVEALKAANRRRGMHLVNAIRKAGGISRDSWDKTFPGETKGEFRMKGVVVNRPYAAGPADKHARVLKPGQKHAMTWEQMAEHLEEAGYGPQSDRDAGRALAGPGAGAKDYSWFVDAMAEAVGGEKVRPAEYHTDPHVQAQAAREHEESVHGPDPRPEWLKALKAAQKGKPEALQWMRDNLEDVREYLASRGELTPQDEVLQMAVTRALDRYNQSGGMLSPDLGAVWFHMHEGGAAVYRFLRGSGAFARQVFLNERTVRTQARKVKAWLDEFRSAVGLYGSAGAEGVTAVEQSYRLREHMQALVLKLEKELGGVDSEMDHAMTLAVESYSKLPKDRSPEETAAWVKVDAAGKRDLVDAVRHVLAETREMSAERHPVRIAIRQVMDAAERAQGVLQQSRTVADRAYRAAIKAEAEAGREVDRAIAAGLAKKTERTKLIDAVIGGADKSVRKTQRRLRSIDRDLRFQQQRVDRWRQEGEKFVAEWGRKDYMPHVPDAAMLKDLQQAATSLNVDVAASPILKMAGHWRRRTNSLEASGRRDPSAVRSLWHYLTQVVPLATMTDYEVRNEAAIYGTRRALTSEEVVAGGPGNVEYFEGRDVLTKRNRGLYWEVTAKTDGAKPRYFKRLEEVPEAERKASRTRRVVILDSLLQGEGGTTLHPEGIASKPGRFTVVTPGTARRSLFQREGGLLSELGQAKREEYEQWHRQVRKVADESVGLADYGIMDRFARKVSHILSAKDIAAFHPGPAVRNMLQTMILNGHRLGFRRTLLTIHLPLSMAARLHSAMKNSTTAELLKGLESTGLGEHTPLRNSHLASLLGTSPKLLERMGEKRRAEALLQDEAFRELLDSPAFTSSLVHDLDGGAHDGPDTSRTRRVVDWLPIIGSKQWALFRGTEAYSRWHLFIDSFVQARQHGMEAPAARQHANDLVLNSHGFQNRANRSAFMQVPLMRMALYMSGWMQHASGTLIRAMTVPTETGSRRLDVAGLRHAAMFAGYLVGVQQLAQALIGKDWARLVGGTLSEVPVVGGAIDDQARKGLEAVGLPNAFQGEIPVPVLPGTWGLAAAPIAEHGLKAIGAWYRGDEKTAGGEWDRFASRLLPNWVRTYRRSFEGEANPEHPGTHFTQEWATGRRIETLPGDLSLGSGAMRAMSDLFGPDLDEQRRWRMAESDRRRHEAGTAERRSQTYRLGLTAREMQQLERARKQPGGDTPERAALSKKLEAEYEKKLEEVARDRDLRTIGQVKQLHWETTRIAQMDQELTASQRRILHAPTLEERTTMFARALNDPSYPLTEKEATDILVLMVGKSLAQGKPDAFARWLKLVPPEAAKRLTQALTEADKRWRTTK